MTAPDVTVTAAAKSKAHRMCSPRALRAYAREAWTGDRLVYRKGEDHEYHALIPPEYAIVVRPSGDELVVITQMHRHADYAAEAVYQPVASIESEVLATA